MSNKVINNTIDTLDQLSTPTSRSGVTVKRIAKLVQNGVSPAVIALQLQGNSKSKIPYTCEQVHGIAHLFEDCKRRPGITKTQEAALLQDNKAHIEELPRFVRNLSKI